MTILSKAEDGLKQLNALVLRNGTSKANQGVLAAAKEDLRAIIAEGQAPEPTPEPEAAPVPAVPDIFQGTKLSAYIHEGGPISEVAAPDGSGDTVFRFDCSDTDGVGPMGANPRCQVYPDPKVVKLPAEFWASGAFWLPTDFPTSVPSWMNLYEGPYGPPFNGSPPVQIDLRDGNVGWDGNGHDPAGAYTQHWRRPYVRGRKNTWLLHVIQTGLVEMWLNGTQVCSVKMPTTDASNVMGPQALYLQSYRAKGMFPKVVTVYHWPLAIGTRRELVESR